MNTMKFKNYIYPHLVLASIKGAMLDLQRLSKYKSILDELEAEDKLQKMGFNRDNDKLFVGVNLNPELLMYAGESLDSAELKFVSDAMLKYTNFLQKEGILDVIKADYERVYNEDFYGYVVEISFDFKAYVKKKYIYDIAYCTTVVSTGIISIYALISSFL